MFQYWNMLAIFGIPRSLIEVVWLSFSLFKLKLAIKAAKVSLYNVDILLFHILQKSVHFLSSKLPMFQYWNIEIFEWLTATSMTSNQLLVLSQLLLGLVNSQTPLGTLGNPFSIFSGGSSEEASDSPKIVIFRGS